MHRTALALAAATALGVAMPATVAPAVAARPFVHTGRVVTPLGRSIPVVTNPSWSGYIATPISTKVTTFTHVQASYGVPAADCATTPNTFAYQWVGLDGYTSSTVEQDGVGVICSGANPTYFAWYEMYPGGLQEQFAVAPGDAVSSSVTFDRATQDYTLALTDTTTGKGFSLVESCPAGSTCDNSSAEVISEGYTTTGTLSGTSDFGTEAFGAIHLGGTTASGAPESGALKDQAWGLVEAEAVNSSGSPDTQAGPISQSGKPARSSFTVTWLRQD